MVPAGRGVLQQVCKNSLTKNARPRPLCRALWFACGRRHAGRVVVWGFNCGPGVWACGALRLAL